MFSQSMHWTVASQRVLSSAPSPLSESSTCPVSDTATNPDRDGGTRDNTEVVSDYASSLVLKISVNLAKVKVISKMSKTDLMEDDGCLPCPQCGGSILFGDDILC